jgi:hypothetical protein
MLRMSPQGVVSERTVQTINSMVRTEGERARIIEHSRTEQSCQPLPMLTTN